MLRRRTTPTSNGNGEEEFDFNYANGTTNGYPAAGSKDGGISVDWYTEGPGRRVGYDDLTAIDWIFEYAKERQRLRLLYASATGIFGQIKRFLDGSQIWLILLFTGVATGLVAASIDVASDWLGDMKLGICRRGSRGGKFYLNRSFCCWGLDGKWIQDLCLDDKC